MLKSLTEFSFENKQIRTFGTKFEPWFAAVDVCAILDIKNSRDAVSRLDEDEKGVVLTDTPGGQQEISIINESGFYTLILRSRKPEAKAFRRWVTHEVLPSIRKRGYYLDPRWGFAPTDDGLWVLATGERLSMYQVRQRAEKLGISIGHNTELKEVVREINQRERLLAIKEKYPHSYDDVDRMYGDVEYYRCFIKDNEDRSIYSADYGIDEYFSDAFIDLIKRIDERDKNE